MFEYSNTVDGQYIEKEFLYDENGNNVTSQVFGVNEITRI